MILSFDGGSPAAAAPFFGARPPKGRRFRGETKNEEFGRFSPEPLPSARGCDIIRKLSFDFSLLR
jgi:hypothetical protein